jgi:hypothetical protein
LANGRLEGGLVNRFLDVREDDQQLDEAQMATWIRQVVGSPSSRADDRGQGLGYLTFRQLCDIVHFKGDKRMKHKGG